MSTFSFKRTIGYVIVYAAINLIVLDNSVVFVVWTSVLFAAFMSLFDILITKRFDDTIKNEMRSRHKKS